MRNFVPAILLALFVSLSAVAQYQGDRFRKGVRDTEPLSPEEERETFVLPEGFEVTLFASEPQINKPMNMAFDTKGRLWVTSTLEYPYAAKPGKKARDSVKVLEDTDGDGKADKVTTFADDLNIPTGVYPYKNGVVIWSIPNIWYIEDTDGDGVGDKRTKLYGPLGYERDTHGMHSSFTRGYDGWLHITHGFNNYTTVEAKDGSSIKIQSGNTYRVRIDDSSVQQYTWGQVNPFGMYLDSLGNFYTADCHSSPIYQLIRQGYYPSFGKPHDGLGFAPTMIQHSHGSTAICGIVMYEDDLWPKKYWGNLFIGNVMTSRVNQDSVTWHGSSPVGKEEPDFIKTSDPWYRPVDIQLGPDGALYVADFYNRIIGHYEVPLDHPGRDRTSGRIWRITYKGKAHPKLDLSTPEKSISELSSPNITRQQLALQHLADNCGSISPELLKKELKHPKAAHLAAWILHRSGNLAFSELMDLVQSKEPLHRLHAQRILADISVWSPEHQKLALNGLEDKDPFVQRAAAEALSLHPSAVHVVPLATHLHKTNLHDALQVKGSRGSDTHLLHTLQIALRNQMQEKGAFEKINSTKLESPVITSILPQIAVSVQSEDAAKYLLSKLGTWGSDLDEDKVIPHITRNLSLERLKEFISRLRGQSQRSPRIQAKMLSGIYKGILQRGGEMDPVLKEWSIQLAAHLLTAQPAKSNWTNEPLPDPNLFPDNPWGFQTRKFQEGNEGKVLSSFGKKEEFTGVLRSQPFKVPAKLSFYLCGHDGPPGKPIAMKNFLRLRDAANDQVLKEVQPPRNDTAQKVTWNLEEFGGREAYIEVVDGNNAKAYAWLAFADFEPTLPQLALVEPESPGQLQEAGIQLIQDLQLVDLSAQLQTLAEHSSTTDRIKKLAKDTLDSLLGKTVQPVADASLSGKAMNALISKRLEQYNAANTNVQKGRAIFQLYCAACHKKGDIGELVGPQLDGISSRGTSRLIEDILDPNRNVDVAFRYTTLTLKDGRVIQGLKRREEGQAIVFADLTGRETTLATSSISKMEATELSLMPAALGAAIPKDDFANLLAFLMDRK
jgi:putative heme-binding domain-containing protein